MKKNELTMSYPGFFEAKQSEETVVLRFSGNFFHNSINFDKRDFFLEYLAALSRSNEIKSLIMHSAYSETGRDEYLYFFLREGSKRPLSYFGFTDTMNHYELHRFCNCIDQFVLRLTQMEKFLIHICSGDVLSQVLNTMLICDHRIIGDNTVFHNIFQTIGTVPKGGCTFLMQKLLGPAKMKALLLLHPRISATMALENGLADKIVAAADIEAEAISVANLINKLPFRTVTGIKRIANWANRELEAYLEFETAEVTKFGTQTQIST